MNKGYYWPIGSGNKPNILSNDLDQAPKNTNTRYQARIDALSTEIETAFKRYSWVIRGDDAIINRLKNHENDIPLQKINEIPVGTSLSIELRRESKTAQKWGREKAVWPLVDPNMLSIFRWKMLSKLNNSLQPGDTATYLVIKKQYLDPRFPKNQDCEISLEQVEIPEENALLPKWFVFHKEVKDNEAEVLLKDINL